MGEGWRHYLSIETIPLIYPYRVSSDLHGTLILQMSQISWQSQNKLL